MKNTYTDQQAPGANGQENQNQSADQNAHNNQSAQAEEFIEWIEQSELQSADPAYRHPDFIIQGC